MAWWLTLLVAGIGASGGVAGGWLSGRLGSKATLRAVREERAARARLDYLTALGALNRAAALLIVVWTELPPESDLPPIGRLTRYPDRLLGKLFATLLTDRERASFAKHPIMLRFSRETPVGRLTLGVTQSHAFEESLLRRLDTFAEASSRAKALAPDEDLDLLAKIETFVFACVENPPAQGDALAEWQPLQRDLADLESARRTAAP